MNQSAEKALSYLTGNEDIDTVTIADLQKLTEENPYFPVGQFLLARKLKSENDQSFISQAQKASLYFSNPYWLYYQLFAVDIDRDTAQHTGKTVSEHESKDNFSPVESLAFEETIRESSASYTENQTVSGYPKDKSKQEIAESNNAELKVELVENINSANDFRKQEAKGTVEAKVSQAEEEMAAITRGTDEAAQRFINDPDAKTMAGDRVLLGFHEDLPVAAEAEIVEMGEEMAGVTHHSGNSTGRFLEELQTGSQAQREVLPDEHDMMFKNIKAMLDASSEEAAADTKDAVIPIDPYYTIDYFASQGIKLELDQNPKDQLGQNLKKFTQWLKHMKKLGPEDATEVISRTESEEDIQQIANSSNTVREVVTEAMASVLEKQGKKDKAVELYNKLSFLNPDKSAYFADKVKKLKGI